MPALARLRVLRQWGGAMDMSLDGNPIISATPVAWKVSGLPPSVPEVAVRLFVPAAVPSCQLPTVATPLAFVVCQAARLARKASN